MDVFGLRWPWLLLVMLQSGFYGVKLVLCEIEYNTINEDGSFTFRHSNDDIGGYYHSASGSPDNVVRGRYGSRSPASGQVEEVVYSAGPRGFRVNGPKIHRKMDLAQFPIRPIGSPDDPLADPYDDPTYSFSYRTPDKSRSEDNDATGRVRGLYSYIDDVGERHSVRYAAGAGTGFEVSNSVPDNPAIVGYSAPLYKAPPRTRGKMSVQRGPNGSYKLIAAGPDHRRAESRGSDGLVKGTYSYLDDKGIQRTVEYIAGAGIGYRIVQNRVGPGTHINPSVAEFRLSDTDFKLANDFGRGAGGGLGLGGGKGAGRVGGGPGAAAAGSDYLKSDGPSKVRPNGGDNAAGGSDDIDDDDEVGTDDDGGGGTGDSSRFKSDRMGAASENRGGMRYRGGEGTPGSSANVDDDENLSSGDHGTAKLGERRNNRPSSNRNSLSSGERMRTRNRHRDRGSNGPNGSSNRGGLRGGGSSTTSLSMRTSGEGYSYDAPAASSSSNNYNFKDDEVGSLPPLITANRMILEIDRERDWVARNRDSTVIKNVGQWYLGLPPGQSVRAHVQSIDVLPLGGRSVLSPSEALRQDEVADMVASLESWSGGTAYRSS